MITHYQKSTDGLQINLCLLKTGTL